MTDSEDEVPAKSSENQLELVKLLRDFPIIFSKSQTPIARKNKSRAIEMIKKRWEVICGTTITVQQLLKNINNMKTRLKKKTDLNRTGNRKIVLNDCEKILLDIMDGDSNPIITRIPGATSAGSDPISTPPLSPEIVVNRQKSCTPPPHKKRRISPLQEYETETTKHLSNSELQRLVLLTQLRVLTLKEEKLKRELNDH